MQKILKTTAIQDELILNYQQYNIEPNEFICICQLLTIDPLQIDLISFLRKTKNNKPIISSLATKKLITLGEVNGKVTIDLSKLYELMSSDFEQLEQVGLSNEQVDRLVFIFGKKLLPNEIMKINSWLASGATFQQIEEAIYTALAREINNLNYIEKIILNNNTTVETVVNNESSIKRNWTY